MRPRDAPLPRLAPAALIALAGCGAPVRDAPAPPPPVPAHAPAPAPRWLVIHSSWIERGEDGLDHVVAGGRRLEVRGMEIVRAAPADPEVDGGARAPSFSPQGPSRYVFWKGAKLYTAASFAGPLAPLAAIPAEPVASFDWLSGAGLIFPGGAVVVPAKGGPPAPLGVAGAVDALAADARRAVAFTALGHALVTADGGATYRDVSADLGPFLALAVRGDALTVRLADGRSRVITPSGSVASASPEVIAAPPRGRRPVEDPDRFPGGSAVWAVDAAVQAGLPLPDGGLAVPTRGFVGRLDEASLTTTSLAALDPGLASAECVAFRAPDGPMLACAGEGRAALVDISGAPRTERTFDFKVTDDERDRFVGADGEALGYLGPCDGAPDPTPDVEVVIAGETYNASRQRSPVFCVRAGRDTWIEHRLDPADATDVIAWIPRAGGGAVALVARPGTFLDDRERVTARGGLRVVRVARNEPPLAVSAYSWDQAAVLNRSLRVSADDTIEGWLAVGLGVSSIISIEIDAAGHPRAFPEPPRAGPLSTAGRFALTRADDGKLWETADFGHRWTIVDPPPGFARERIRSCSPAGCRFGSFARLGWSEPGTPGAVSFDGAAAVDLREKGRVRRDPPAPIVRLACAFAGPPESRRVPDSGGFGYTQVPKPRNAAVRIGTMGVASVPRGSGPIALAGDVDLGWLTPLDVSGAVHRAAIPLAAFASADGEVSTHELEIGWALAPDGSIDAVPAGSPDHCPARILTRAGITLPISGCVEPPLLGAEARGRLYLLHPDLDTLRVFTAPAPPRRGLPPSGAVALREIASIHAGGAIHGVSVAAGTRAGLPVAVAVDRLGDASLAPLDPDRGTLGAEERLAPLRAIRLGTDPACAPRPDDARALLVTEGAIGLDRAGLRGLAPAAPGTPGLAVVRWSRDRACLDAVEIPVRDERFDEGPGMYEPPGAVRKVIARFDNHAPARAALVSVSPGAEVRQPLSCSGIAAP